MYVVWLLVLCSFMLCIIVTNLTKFSVVHGVGISGIIVSERVLVDIFVCVQCTEGLSASTHYYS